MPSAPVPPLNFAGAHAIRNLCMWGDEDTRRQVVAAGAIVRLVECSKVTKEEGAATSLLCLSPYVQARYLCVLYTGE